VPVPEPEPEPEPEPGPVTVPDPTSVPVLGAAGVFPPGQPPAAIAPALTSIAAIARLGLIGWKLA
jgi:hypothetical protein